MHEYHSLTANILIATKNYGKVSDIHSYFVTEVNIYVGITNLTPRDFFSRVIVVNNQITIFTKIVPQSP